MLEQGGDSGHHGPNMDIQGRDVIAHPALPTTCSRARNVTPYSGGKTSGFSIQRRCPPSAAPHPAHRAAPGPQHPSFHHCHSSPIFKDPHFPCSSSNILPTAPPHAQPTPRALPNIPPRLAHCPPPIVPPEHCPPPNIPPCAPPTAYPTAPRAYHCLKFLPVYCPPHITPPHALLTTQCSSSSTDHRLTYRPAHCPSPNIPLRALHTAYHTATPTA